MNKKAKIIIGVLSCIIVVLVIVIILLLNNKGKANTTPTTEQQDTEINNVVGIYHIYNWNNNGEATLQLNKDFTCKYPHNSYVCKWTLSDDKVTITLTSYYIHNDNYEQIGTSSVYYTLESCNEALTKLSNEYINPRCEGESTTHEAILINNGILLHDHNFNKMK